MNPDKLESPASKIEQIRWKNTDTIEYFENIPIETFRNFAIKGGLEEGCDIDIIYPYIDKTNSLIEVGASYRRVIKKLVKKGYTGKIYAVERSKNFCKHLRNDYETHAEIINTDIQYFEFKYKVDAILLMWSGIGEFAKEEQLPLLKKMVKWLNPDGVLVLETILHTLVPRNATLNQDQTFIILSKHGTFYGYKPSKEEIDAYGKKLGFGYIKHINYQTDTQRHRILHIFSHHPL